MYPIRVHNKKRPVPLNPGEELIYLGRPHKLGNPFRMKSEADRDWAVTEYQKWLRAQYAAKGVGYDALMELATKAKDHPLGLQCFCAPLPCHCDIVKDAIEKIIKSGKDKNEK